MSRGSLPNLIRPPPLGFLLPGEAFSDHPGRGRAVSAILSLLTLLLFFFTEPLAGSRSVLSLMVYGLVFRLSHLGRQFHEGRDLEVSPGNFPGAQVGSWYTVRASSSLKDYENDIRCCQLFLSLDIGTST